jgi:hypothetical protein
MRKFSLLLVWAKLLLFLKNEESESGYQAIEGMGERRAFRRSTWTVGSLDGMTVPIATWDNSRRTFSFPFLYCRRRRLRRVFGRKRLRDIMGLEDLIF